VNNETNGKEDCNVLEKTQIITDLVMLFVLVHLKAMFHYISFHRYNNDTNTTAMHL